MIVHPLVLLSIVDNYNRVASSVSSSEALSKAPSISPTATQVPFEEDDKDPSIWFLDHNYHESMFSMFKRINAKEHVVGCYVPNPVLVIIDVQPKELGIPTKAYYAVEEVKENATLKSQKVFAHVPSEIAAHEVEEIGVEHLLWDVKDTTISTLATEVTGKLAALKGLDTRLREIRGYLDLDVFNLLPNLNVAELIEAFAVFTGACFFAMYATLASRDVDCCLIPESPFFLEVVVDVIDIGEHVLKLVNFLVWKCWKSTTFVLSFAIQGLTVGGGFLFSSSFDKTVHVWSLQKLFEQKDWRYSGIHALAISGTGYLYTGSGDKSIKAWSLQDYSLPYTMNGHKSVVSTLAVCNGVLYSGSWDGTVRLWCLSDHSPLTVLGEDVPGNVTFVLSLGTCGDALVVAHENGCMKIWRNVVNVQELLGDEFGIDAMSLGSIACDSVGRADRVIKRLLEQRRKKLQAKEAELRRREQDVYMYFRGSGKATKMKREAAKRTMMAALP
ncbi:unnamed protein product [Camellia sinensis]